MTAIKECAGVTSAVYNPFCRVGKGDGTVDYEFKGEGQNPLIEAIERAIAEADQGEQMDIVQDRVEVAASKNSNQHKPDEIKDETEPSYLIGFKNSESLRAMITTPLQR